MTSTQQKRKQEKALFYLFYKFKDFIYLFLEREEGRKKQRNRNIHV